MALPLGLEYSCECVKYPMRHFRREYGAVRCQVGREHKCPLPLHRCNARSLPCLGYEATPYTQATPNLEQDILPGLGLDL
jgi:hypothetical protein